MEERTLHDRLVEIQSSLKAPKGQYNSFGKYKYRSAEDILEAVKPILRAQNCKLTIMDEIVQVGERIYVKAIATISDGTQSLSVCAYAREEDEKKGMDASQVTGAASSYARKYALNGLFAIDDTKDADALNTTKEYTERKKEPEVVKAEPEPKPRKRPEPKKEPEKDGKPEKEKPVVKEGDKLWPKAVEYCLKHNLSAADLRKWYTISDKDAATLDNVLAFDRELNK